MDNIVPKEVIDWFLKEVESASTSRAKKPFNCVMAKVEREVFSRLENEKGSQVKASEYLGVSRQRFRYCIGCNGGGVKRSLNNYTIPNGDS